MTEQDKIIKLFSVSRFESAESCGKQFTPDVKFDVDKFFEDSFGIFNEHKIIKVKIYFEKGSARYVKEKIWHSSQVIKENPDGSIILEMKVNGSSEIKHWILSWGKNCRLISPKKLVNEIKKDLSTALEKYE
ncbi:MAG: WYL domain-containing protein [Ignavibacteria bacterium]|nr:WYL domain-containing protein [Ignavibacteria bacterium]